MPTHEHEILLTKIEDLSQKVEENQTEILMEFIKFKENICFPMRLKVKEVEIKSGFIGAISSAVVIGIQLIFKKIVP